MKYQLLTSAAVVLALTTAVACDKRTSDDTTSQTHTTSADASTAPNGESIGQDLRQAGKSLGAAAEKTAKKLDEVKVDVHVDDKDSGAAPSHR
jgi:hypothetical protein